jgi:hypothetical protein
MPTVTIDRVQALADRAELTDLVSRLGNWLDGGGAGDAAALLVEDAWVSTPGGQATGRDALVAQARRNHDVPTQHLITNVLVDVEGDAAEVTANLVVTFVDEPGTPGAHHRHGESYAFEARRTADGWRLASVTVRPVWRDA